MSAHRFQDHLIATAETESIFTSANAVFMPFASFSTAFHQVSNIQEIYRLAAERTREQLKPQRNRVLQFSLN